MIRYLQNFLHQSWKMRPKQGTERIFGFVLSAFLAVVSGAFYWLGVGGWPWLAAASITTVLLTVSAPALLRPVNLGLYFFGRGVSFVLTPVLSFVFFYSIIMPIGLLMRMTGKDPLKKEAEPKVPSYWIHTDNKTLNSINFERQY